MDFGSDIAQIFSKEGQPPESLPQFDEQVIARTIHPSPAHRSRVSRGNLPELVEAAKVIQSDVIAVIGCPAQPLNPPFVAALLHHIPAVERIAPALSGGAEKIRRHPSYHL